MGLDIFLYNVKKVPNIKDGDLVIEKQNDYQTRFLPIYNKNGSVINYCSTIMNNAKKIFKDDRIINMESIYRKYSKKQKDEADITIGGWGHGRYIMRIDGESIEISDNEIENEHSYIKRNEYYICIMEEVAYQRGISEEGWDYLPENCSYCDDEEVFFNLLDNGLDAKFEYYWSESTVLVAWW